MTKPLKTTDRRQDIQGLRAISVILVVLFHLGLPVPGGFIGVDIFFVISGYVITRSFSLEWSRSGTIRLGSFFVRRVRRLLAALAVVIAFTTVVSILLESPNGAQQGTAKTAFGALTLLSNFAILRWTGDYFSHYAEANPLLHTWSLSVEEQFFLVFPVLLLVGWRVGQRLGWNRLGPFASLAMISVPSLALALITSFGHFHIPAVGGSPQAFAFYSSATRAWEFAVGSFLCLGLEGVGRISKRVRETSGFLGLSLILLSALLINGSQPFPGVVALLPVCGAALVIVNGFGSRTGTTKFLERSVLVRIGDLSYSWYLWHWPFIVFARLIWSDEQWVLVIAAVISLLPAAASYRWVENPVRFSPRFSGRRLAPIVALTLLVPFALTILLAVGARHGWGLDWPVGQHTVMRNDCVGSSDLTHCTWPEVGSRGTVILAGDSQAWSVADGVIAAAAELEHRTTVVSTNGCPFILLPTGQPNNEQTHNRADGSKIGDPSCDAHRRGIVEMIVATRPSAVLIANQDHGYSSIVPNQHEWEAALETTVRRIRSEGIPVVIMIPRPDGDKESTASLLFPGSANRWKKAIVARESRFWHREMAGRISGSDPRVDFFDPSDTLCDEAVCWSARDGVDYYTNFNHLSRSGALLLAPSLRAVLEPMIGR